MAGHACIRIPAMYTHAGMPRWIPAKHAHVGGKCIASEERRCLRFPEHVSAGYYVALSQVYRARHDPSPRESVHIKLLVSSVFHTIILRLLMFCGSYAKCAYRCATCRPQTKDRRTDRQNCRSISSLV